MANSQLVMPLEDARTDASTQKLRGAKTTLDQVRFKFGNPTQTQLDFLDLIFGSDSHEEIDAFCQDENLPNPWQVPPAQMAIAAIGVVAALAPPARKGRKKRTVLEIAEQLRRSLHARKRHRSQIGVPCQPLWGSEPTSTEHPQPENQLTLEIGQH